MHDFQRLRRLRHVGWSTGRARIREPTSRLVREGNAKVVNEMVVSWSCVQNEWVAKTIPTGGELMHTWFRTTSRIATRQVQTYHELFIAHTRVCCGQCTMHTHANDVELFVICDVDIIIHGILRQRGEHFRRKTSSRIYIYIYFNQQLHV